MKNAPDLFYRAGVKLGGSLIEFDPIKKNLAINDTIPLVFPKEEVGFKYNNGNIEKNGGELAPLKVRKYLQ